MHLSRVFAGVAIVFGSVFVLVNAGRLSHPWDVVAFVVGGLLVVAATWRTVLPSAHDVTWSGSPRAYWIAVGAEVVAIPLGASVLNRVLDQPDLVVLWVVFVVGAHFLPAHAFGLGRYAELGIVLMSLATVFAAIAVILDVDWSAPAGAVLAGYTLLGFTMVPRFCAPQGQTGSEDDVRST